MVYLWCTYAWYRGIIPPMPALLQSKEVLPPTWMVEFEANIAPGGNKSRGLYGILPYY